MTKFVRIKIDDDIKWGMVEGDSVALLNTPPWEGSFESGDRVPLDLMKLAAPVAPTKIVLIGLNYHAHIKESQSASAVPEEPVIFMKPLTALIGPNDNIVYPKGVDRVDYEGELAVIIGKKLSKVDEHIAAEGIFGYTCLNDVTARNLQKKDVQWTRAKGFDSFCPIGPFLVTGIDPLNLKIETVLNNDKKQSSNTSFQIWNVFKLVSFISKVMTLLPGDVISTGTPEGIGPVKPGDRMKITIENIGTLENGVIAG